MVKVETVQSSRVATSESLTGQRTVNLVLCLLKHPLPYRHGDNDALCAPVRPKVDRLVLTCVEALGDLVECVTGLARRDYINHEINVRESVRIR